MKGLPSRILCKNPCKKPLCALCPLWLNRKMGNQKKKERSKKHAKIFFGGLIAIICSLTLFYQFKADAQLMPVTFSGSSDGAKAAQFKLEIAADNQSRIKGLMYRKEMDEDKGMLFVFSKPSKQSFHMKNTYLSLDMIFVGANKKVVGILHSVPPLNQVPRNVEAKSQYVIELNAGMAKKYGIKQGAQVDFLKPLPKGTVSAG